MKSCKTCRYLSSVIEANPQCRYDPPKVFPVPRPEGIASIAMWPIVEANQWCGKYEANLADASN